MIAIAECDETRYFKMSSTELKYDTNRNVSKYVPVVDNIKRN